MEIRNSLLDAWEVDRLFEVVEDYTEATREQIEKLGVASSREVGMARHLIFVVLFLLGYTPREERKMVDIQFVGGGGSDQRRASIDLYNNNINFRATAKGILRHFTQATGRKQVHEWITKAMLTETNKAEVSAILSANMAKRNERKRKPPKEREPKPRRTRLTDEERLERKRVRERAYADANRERINARKRAYRKENKERINAYMRAFREANKEKFKAYHLAYKERREQAQGQNA